MSEEKSQGKINIWKWAFISLFILLIAFVFWFMSLLQTSSEEPQPDQDERMSQYQDSYQDPYQLQMALDTQEVERFVNDYVKTLEMEDLTLQVNLQDRLEIHARYHFLNREWPFTIYLLPEVTEEGNVILEVDNFRMGQLPVPETWLIKILNTSMDWPSWIVPDETAQTIDLYFDQQVFADDFQVKVTQVDLENERLAFDFLISSDVFKEELSE